MSYLARLERSEDADLQALRPVPRAPAAATNQLQRTPDGPAALCQADLGARCRAMRDFQGRVGNDRLFTVLRQTSEPPPNQSLPPELFQSHDPVDLMTAPQCTPEGGVEDSADYERGRQLMAQIPEYERRSGVKITELISAPHWDLVAKEWIRNVTEVLITSAAVVVLGFAGVHLAGLIAAVAAISAAFTYLAYRASYKQRMLEHTEDRANRDGTPAQPTAEDRDAYTIAALEDSIFGGARYLDEADRGVRFSGGVMTADEVDARRWQGYARRFRIGFSVAVVLGLIAFHQPAVYRWLINLLKK